MRDAFRVDWHTDMLVRAWRLASPVSSAALPGWCIGLTGRLLGRLGGRSVTGILGTSDRPSRPDSHKYVATTTTTSTTSSSADEKPPKHFTAWAQCVETITPSSWTADAGVPHQHVGGRRRGSGTPLSRHTTRASCTRPSHSGRSCHAGPSRPARP